MSELTTQAERYEQLSRKFTSLYHQVPDDLLLFVTDLETQFDENIDAVPSQVFFRQLHEALGKNSALLLELIISTISQERTLAIRRINFFGSEEGLYFLKTLPLEKDIDNPKEELNDFCRHYAKRFQAIQNQIISRYSPNPDEAIEKLQKEFGRQLTEEIVSGGEGLSRSAFIAPEDIMKEAEALYRPILLLRIPVSFREDTIPIIPYLLRKVDEFHLLQPGRETIEIDPEALLRAIFAFSADLLTSIQYAYSLQEEKYLVDLYRSFTSELLEFIRNNPIDWSLLLPQMKTIIDKLVDDRKEDSSEENDTREVLEFARRRSTSFLIRQWYPEFIDRTIDVIRTASRKPIIEFIKQSGDLMLHGINGTANPEEMLDAILSESSEIESQAEKKEEKTALRSIRSSIQSRIIEPNLLNEFAEFCKTKMHISCTTSSTTFDPSRNVSAIFSNLKAFQRSKAWELRDIEKIRQSVNLAIDELNNLKPRQISEDDLLGLFEYLTYWGVDPPGGSLIQSGTLMVASSDPSLLISFQLDRKIGVVALVCLEATIEDEADDEEDASAKLHDYKSLQAVLSRLKEKFEAVEIPDFEEPVETPDREEPVEPPDREEPVEIPDFEEPVETPDREEPVETPGREEQVDTSNDEVPE